MYLFKWLFHSPGRNRSLFWSAAVDLALLFHFVKQFCRQEQSWLLWHSASNSCCSIKKRKSRQRGYINSISIIRAPILLRGTRFPFSFVNQLKKTLSEIFPLFTHFIALTCLIPFNGPQRNRKSVLKSTRRHMQCATSQGDKNKQWRALESLVNTEPQASLLCSPLGFPNRQLISVD